MSESMPLTKEKVFEIWDTKKDDFFSLSHRQAYLAMDFCRLALQNFEDIMGHRLQTADVDRILRQELYAMVDTILSECFTGQVAEQLKKEYALRYELNG